MTAPADPPALPAPPSPIPAGPPSTVPPDPAHVPTRGPRRRRWWVAAAVAGWAVLLTVAAVGSARQDRPSVPDQVALLDAVPAVDRAAGVLLAAVPADAAVEFGPLVVDRVCDITPARPGGNGVRTVTVHVRPGEGPAVLRDIAAALPAGYRARGFTRGATPRYALSADAGEFIAIRGRTDGDAVHLQASTGCRPTEGFTAPTDPATRDLPPTLRAALGALGGPATATATVHELRCPDGGVARAVTADAGPAPDDLRRPLDRLTADATVVTADRSRYVYRTGTVSVVATGMGGRLALTATTACR